MYVSRLCCFVFFFKQKTAYEMRISDWSSDVCSSDLQAVYGFGGRTLGSVDAVPDCQLKVIQALLFKGGHIGHDAKALRSCQSVGLERARLDVGAGGNRLVAYQINVSGDKILQGGPRAAIWHHGDIHVGGLFKQQRA